MLMHVGFSDTCGRAFSDNFGSKFRMVDPQTTAKNPQTVRKKAQTSTKKNCTIRFRIFRILFGQFFGESDFRRIYFSDKFSENLLLHACRVSCYRLKKG